MNLQVKWADIDWIAQALDRDRWRTLLKALMDFRVA